MVGRLQLAQAIEHEFYKGCRAAVTAASTRLADYFSELIQRQMPYWGPQEAEVFSSHTAIDIAEIIKGKRAFDALMQARSRLSQAAAERMPLPALGHATTSVPVNAELFGNDPLVENLLGKHQER